MAAPLVVAFLGCTESHEVDAASPIGRLTNAAGSDSEPASIRELDGPREGEREIPEDCEGISANGTLPRELRCTGLYSDIESKTYAPGIRYFEPAAKLWSDGAEKRRWIYLPEGEKIDNSDPENWELPVGTQFFKEFRWKGQRVETRLYQKIRENRWSKTSYHWDEDEESATRFDGGDVDVNGDTYYIPSALECEQCHKGRRDRGLGFTTLLLGLEGSVGLNLETLVEEDLLTDEPDMDLEIGDDGSGVAAETLGYLHVNCGVSCHNDNPASEGYSSDMRLMLTPAQLNGRERTDYAAIRTGVNVDAQTPRWDGYKRIVPGSPEESLMYVLASARQPGEMKDQMPPIASRVVDPDGIALLERWIRNLPAETESGAR